VSSKSGVWQCSVWCTLVQFDEVHTGNETDSRINKSILHCIASMHFIKLNQCTRVVQHLKLCYQYQSQSPTVNHTTDVYITTVTGTLQLVSAETVGGKRSEHIIINCSADEKQSLKCFLCSIKLTCNTSANEHTQSITQRSDQ